MTLLIPRRTFLRGLFALPAVIAADRLMPLRGERQELWIKYRTWKDGTFGLNSWQAGTCTLKRFERISSMLAKEFGDFSWEFSPPILCEQTLGRRITRIGPSTPLTYHLS